MKYIKKPIEVEVIKFNGMNHDEIADFCNPVPVKVGGKFTLLISTLEGAMVANKNDYIVKGIKGECYPVKPDIFGLTYMKLRNGK